MKNKQPKFQRGFKCTDKLWNEILKLSKTLPGIENEKRGVRTGNGQYLLDYAIRYLFLFYADVKLKNDDFDIRNIQEMG